MGADELLDEDAFDPKKLQDEKQYVTLLVNRDGFSKKQNAAADLMEALLEKNISRIEQEAIFSELKKTNSQQSLINFLKDLKDVDAKAKICAACWESCLDFTNDFLFFVELACHPDFQVSMEALTVVENIESVLDEKTLTAALEIAQNCKGGNKVNVDALIENIKGRIS